MVSRASLRFTLKRILNTFNLLFKNKMAVVGIFLLAAFVFMALAAPILSPYSPTRQVAGPLAQPEWVMNYPDGYYLSKNLVTPSSPSFTSPSDVQAWTLSASTATLANLQESFAQGTSLISSSKGSLQLTYYGDTPATVRISETFQYPYRGPPAEFLASAHYLLKGATSTTPTDVKVFIERGLQAEAQDFYLVNERDATSGTWLPINTVNSTGVLSSTNAALVKFLNIPDGFTPPQLIFSQITSYTYGIEVTFHGHQTINIDDFQLQLYGTAWGLLGTDFEGIDVFTLTIYGSRISLFVGLLAAAIGISLGLIVGLLAGFLGKFVDEVLMRFTDMMLVIPALPLLIVLVAVLGANIYNIILIIGFLGWMGFARIVRSQVLTLRERPFVEAAKASGAGPGRIIVKHIFPNIVSLTYVNLALSVPGAILTEAALAFLGLSDPSALSWGHMFENIQTSGNLGHIPPTWWWVLPPGFGIALVSLSFVLIGYALDEIFNPRLRRRR